MRVSYEDIVAEYERGIQTQLRGFRPAQDFLDTWVHDEDPARSILSMAEAAELEGLDVLEVAVGPETAKRVDATRLTQMLSKVGKTSLTPEGQGLLLKVSYA